MHAEQQHYSINLEWTQFHIRFPLRASQQRASTSCSLLDLGPFAHFGPVLIDYLSTAESFHQPFLQAHELCHCVARVDLDWVLDSFFARVTPFGNPTASPDLLRPHFGAHDRNHSAVVLDGTCDTNTITFYITQTTTSME